MHDRQVGRQAGVQVQVQGRLSCLELHGMAGQRHLRRPHVALGPAHFQRLGWAPFAEDGHVAHQRQLLPGPGVVVRGDGHQPGLFLVLGGRRGGRDGWAVGEARLRERQGVF